VLAQRPGPGVAVLPGDTITLTVAIPPETVVVPNVRGLTERRAADAITGAGLRRGATFPVNHDTVQQGRVVRTAPRAGEEAARGTAVDLYLSRGPRPVEPTPTNRPNATSTPRPTPTGPPATVTVGSYACLQLDTARSRIHSRRLAVGSIQPEGYQDTWVVQGQQPPAGAQVPAGTEVDLTLSESGTC
jgi:beta-lactam-binding protein with PASTA domain